MSTRSRMVHRCLIERRLSTALDAYGNEQPATWDIHSRSQPCYYWQPPGRGEQVGPVNVNVYVHQLLLPLGTDVTEADRINGIYDRAGQPVAARVFNIKAVVRKPDHLLLTLESAS